MAVFDNRMATRLPAAEAIRDAGKKGISGYSGGYFLKGIAGCPGRFIAGTRFIRHRFRKR